ncbi:MAG: hypothetical protein RLZZ387_5255 [Chloroflexota bacterium]
MELAGKGAIVTGAAKGIGAAVARALAREGASIVIADVDTAGAESLAEELRAAGGQALAVRADVSRSDDARRLVDAAVERFGGVDLLVNNAGIQTYGTVETMPEEEWDRTLGVNLKSVFLVSKYAVPEIRRRGGGAIVNIASIQALATQPAVSAYAASKGGIVSMTRSMALDFAADGIRVNCVCPGSVDTPMLRWAADQFGAGDPEGAVRSWGGLHALGRVARPEEVAEMVLFLASPRSSFCTGGAYLVDGGMLASFA